MYMGALSIFNSSELTLEYVLELISQYFWLIPIFIAFIFLIISFITDLDLDQWGSILLFFGIAGLITGGLWYFSDNNNISLMILASGGLAILIGLTFKIIENMWDYENWRIFGIILSVSREITDAENQIEEEKNNIEKQQVSESIDLTEISKDNDE